MARPEVAVIEAPDSVTAFLDWLRAEGFELVVSGDRLRIKPAERVTPELRDRIIRHRAEIFEALSPLNRYVPLKGGLTLPLPALQLAWNLEQRGFQLTLDADERVAIEPQAALMAADRIAIDRWRAHLGAIVAYQPPEAV